jgi:GNAT superfamily N-acetyltransferase
MRSLTLRRLTPRDAAAVGTAHIGLLQVHGRHQGAGIGRQVHDLLLAWVREWPEITTLRAAVVETNRSQATPYWVAMGYAPSGQPRAYQAGAVTSTVTIWLRSVAE